MAYVFSQAVKDQQIALNKLGAGLVVDGLLGPKTQAAIAKYATPTQVKIPEPVQVAPSTPPAPTNGSTPTPTSPTSPATPSNGTTPPPSSVQDPNQPAPNPTSAPTNAPVTDTQTQQVAQPQGAISNLIVGSRGQAVSQLQQALGIKADGIFGPQTQAAVKAYQTSHGLVADGIVGPKTMASIMGTDKGANSADVTGAGSAPASSTTAAQEDNTSTDGTPTKSPMQSVIDTYTEVYKQLGLSDIKAQYQDILKQQTDLQNKKNDEADVINNDPWLSEGVKNAKLNQLDKKYETRLNTMVHMAQLYDSLFKEGQQEAQFLVGHIETDTQNALDLAQKKQTAIDNLTKDNQVVTIGNNEVLINKVTGKQVAVLGPKATTKGTGSATISLPKQKASIQTTLKTGIAPSGEKIGAPRGADGYVDPYVYIASFNNWGGTTAEFLSAFPVAKNVNPASYKILPLAIRPAR